MYDEKEYLYQQFMEHFSAVKDEPLVLYGTGVKTQDLLRRLSGFAIAGLMDPKRTGETMYGLPVLSEQEVARQGVKRIAVVARPAVMGVIYRRIEPFCAENGIGVFDACGSDLKKKFSCDVAENPYFQISADALRREIDRHDVISFDIFDTLLMRRVLEPSDVFHLAGRRAQGRFGKGFDFFRLRTSAEARLNSQGRNPTLSEIYGEMRRAGGLSQEQADALMEIELQTERAVLIPREAMAGLYRYALKQKKKVYLISDMYLETERLAAVLSQNGITGYDGIYVSCAHRASKSQGLFDIFRREVEAERGYLHIGDNETADILCARHSGIDAFQVYSAKEMLEISSFQSLLIEPPSLFERIITGLFIARVFNDPFRLYGTEGKIKIGSIGELGYAFIAPILLCYVLWFVMHIRESGFDLIMFPSRDGCLLQKLYHTVCEAYALSGMPEDLYFYISRRAILMASIQDGADIRKIAGVGFHSSIWELFKIRFDLEIDEEAKGVSASDTAALERYVERYEPQLIAKARQENAGYRRYIAKTGLDTHRKAAFLDFVAGGTAQQYLQRLTKCRLYGLYFLKRDTSDPENLQMPVLSFLKPGGDLELDANAYAFYLYLETILTSQEPTLHSIAPDGSKRFMADSRDDAHKQTVALLQDSVLRYGADLAGICGALFEEMPGRRVPDTIIGFLSDKYSTIDNARLRALVLEDEFLSQKFNIME